MAATTFRFPPISRESLWESSSGYRSSTRVSSFPAATTPPPSSRSTGWTASVSAGSSGNTCVKHLEEVARSEEEHPSRFVGVLRQPPPELDPGGDVVEKIQIESPAQVSRRLVLAGVEDDLLGAGDDHVVLAQDEGDIGPLLVASLEAPAGDDVRVERLPPSDVEQERAVEVIPVGLELISRQAALRLVDGDIELVELAVGTGEAEAAFQAEIVVETEPEGAAHDRGASMLYFRVVQHRESRPAPEPEPLLRFHDSDTGSEEKKRRERRRPFRHHHLQGR